VKCRPSDNRHRRPISRNQWSCLKEIDSQGPISEDESYLEVEVSTTLTLMRLSTSSDINEAWEVIPVPVSDSDHQDKHTPCLNIKYHLRTDDKAIIYLSTIGTETEKRDIFGGTTKRDYTPVSYDMRLQLTAKTDYPAYSWLNEAVIIGCAVKIDDILLYDAFQLD
jgi:hypothetical protein